MTEVGPGLWDITVLVMRSSSALDSAMVQEHDIRVTLLDAQATILANGRLTADIVEVGGSLGTTTSVPFQAAIGDQSVATITVSYGGQDARFVVEQS